MMDKFDAHVEIVPMHPREIIITLENIARWPKFKQLLDQGQIVPDKNGRLGYLHGAPVGRLILVRTTKDGSARYKESAEEWFAPDSPRAAEFKWPE